MKGVLKAPIKIEIDKIKSDITNKIDALDKITYGQIEITDLVRPSQYNLFSLEKIGNIAQLVFDCSLDETKSFATFQANRIAKLPNNFCPISKMSNSFSFRNGDWAYFILDLDGEIIIQPFTSIREHATFSVSLSYIVKKKE